jgi:hypothetical protein
MMPLPNSSLMILLSITQMKIKVILQKKFSTIIIELLAWCTHNRLDINWTKTFLMVVTNKHIKIPLSFLFNDIEIKCVEEFKLLGVTIDSKLNLN